jgi:hypothetical protein
MSISSANISFRHVPVLVAVVDHGGLAAASSSLHTTQSALKIRAAQHTSDGANVDASTPAETVPILGVDLATRGVDTAAWLTVPVAGVHAKAGNKDFFDFQEKTDPFRFSNDAGATVELAAHNQDVTTSERARVA